MSVPAPRAARITTPRELALRLLAGQTLSRCAGGGWLVGDDLAPIDPAVFAALRTGFRLVPAGDALPGFGSSFAQTLLLEPLQDEKGVQRALHQAVDQAGGMAAFAAQRRLSKGQLGDALAERYDRIAPNIAAALGLVSHTVFVPLRAGRS